MQYITHIEEICYVVAENRGIFYLFVFSGSVCSQVSWVILLDIIYLVSGTFICFPELYTFYSILVVIIYLFQFRLVLSIFLDFLLYLFSLLIKKKNGQNHHHFKVKMKVHIEKNMCNFLWLNVAKKFDSYFHANE